MGAVNFSIDQNLVKVLQNALNQRVFVETGTFMGDTIQSVLPMFDRIHSVEISVEYFRRCRKRFSGVGKLKLERGESPEFLRRLAGDLSSESVSFWLDAHWCAAEDTGGEDSQCPLLDELTAIGQLNESSVIMIDDARLFLCSPCSPHKVSQWPTFQEVLDHLRQLSPIHRIMILNDVILFYPPVVGPLLEKYAHDHGIDWLHLINRAKAADELEKAYQEQQAVLNFFMRRALEIPKDREDLWAQLVEKEAVIQGLVKQLTVAQRKISESAARHS